MGWGIAQSKHLKWSEIFPTHFKPIYLGGEWNPLFFFKKISHIRISVA